MILLLGIPPLSKGHIYLLNTRRYLGVHDSLKSVSLSRSSVHFYGCSALANMTAASINCNVSLATVS